MIHLRFLAGVLATLVCFYAIPAGAQYAEEEAARTPPRTSFIEGQVSYWRPGAEDWVPARLNLPLAPGDLFYVGDNSNLELQTGARDFIRAGEKTELGLVGQKPDFLQIRVTDGLASLDLRTLPAGYTIEVDTPNAVFTVERSGYYRVEVDGDTTHFIARRGGRATVIPLDGEARAISPSEEVIVRGTDKPTVESYVAPELDDWDRWNYARTDHALDAISTRYVSSGIYGVEALDHYGTWRVVPTYGPVWVPDGMVPGWAPYSTGAWIWDPYYGWTWVDEAPWGWAPYHYGRWVFIDGFWAWVPGPIVVRPVYAPALVAFFFLGHNVSIRIGIGSPAVCWVALGWGEPLIPWWGRRGFIGVPWWAGWGGPLVVNNVVINRTTIVNVTNITFQNTTISNSVIVVQADKFGRGPIREARIATPLPLRELRASRDLAPVRGELPVKPLQRSLVVDDVGAAVRPPHAGQPRPVAATRLPSAPKLPWRPEKPGKELDLAAPAPRIVTAPKHPPVSARPSFGTEIGAERARPPLPPRLEEMRTPEMRPAVPRERGARVEGERAPSRAIPPAAPSRSQIEPPRGFPEQATPGAGRRETPPAAAMPRKEVQPGEEQPREEIRSLPGKPANQLYPRREGKEHKPRGE